MYLWQARQLNDWFANGLEKPETERSTFLSKSSGLWEDRVDGEGESVLFEAKEGEWP